MRGVGFHKLTANFVSLAALSATAIALCWVAAPDPAHARKTSSTKKPAQSSLFRQDQGPYIVTVSIGSQRLRIFNKSGQVSSSRVSSGRPGFDTPTGVFSIIQKKKRHTSNIYGSSMPFMQRLTWSGIALHAGHVPGYRASHGCIRLPHRFAQSLFGKTGMGERVIVTRGQTRPVPFSHPNLPKPLPKELPEQNGIASRNPNETQVASISKTDTYDTQSTLQQLVNLPSYFWFTPALAQAVEGIPENEPRPRTRGEADELVAKRLERLTAQLATAKQAHQKARDDLKASSIEVRKAYREFTRARRQLRRLNARIKQHDAKRARAEQKLHTFLANHLAGKTDDSAGSFEYTEAELEDSILAEAYELTKARTQKQALNNTIQKLENNHKRLKQKNTNLREQQASTATDLKTASVSLVAAKREIARRRKPISLMISLKSKKVYVRQGFESVIEAPITVHGTPRQFGTHVFTAMDYREDDDDQFDWHLVTAQAPRLLTGKRGRRYSRRLNVSKRTLRKSAQYATAALNSFSLPPEIEMLVSELAKPGASLIVSDQALPRHENGKGVEFVVLTK